MINETETEETIGFVSSFLSLVAFHLGGGGGAVGLPGHAYGFMITGRVFSHTNNIKFGITKNC